MNKLQDKEILHQVYYERYKTNEAMKLLSIVDKANKEIAIKLRKTKGVYSKKRYTEIAKYLNDVTKQVRSQLEDGIDINGTIEEEIESLYTTENLVINSVLLNDNNFSKICYSPSGDVGDNTYLEKILAKILLNPNRVQWC